MKYYFSPEEKSTIGHLLVNLIIKFRPNRKERRHLTRLAKKFEPSSTYVWLKQKEHDELATLVSNSLRALDSVEEQNAPKGILEKAKRFVVTHEPSEKLKEIKDQFEAVAKRMGGPHVYQSHTR